MTTRAVMSLVIEAMGRAMSERREYSTEECVVSRTRAALERSEGAASEARPAYFRCTGNAVPPDRAAAWEAAAASSRPANAVAGKPSFIDCRTCAVLFMRLSNHPLCRRYVTDSQVCAPDQPARCFP